MIDLDAHCDLTVSADTDGIWSGRVPAAPSAAVCFCRSAARSSSAPWPSDPASPIRACAAVRRLSTRSEPSLSSLILTSSPGFRPSRFRKSAGRTSRPRSSRRAFPLMRGTWERVAVAHLPGQVGYLERGHEAQFAGSRAHSLSGIAYAKSQTCRLGRAFRKSPMHRCIGSGDAASKSEALIREDRGFAEPWSRIVAVAMARGSRRSGPCDGQHDCPASLAELAEGSPRETGERRRSRMCCRASGRRSRVQATRVVISASLDSAPGPLLVSESAALELRGDPGRVSRPEVVGNGEDAHARGHRWRS